MCSTNHETNKGKEKMNEDSTAKQNNAKKRKVIVLEEKTDAESKSSKCHKNDNGEEESTNSPKEASPFVLFGFIIDPTKESRKAYSCNFCNQKFVSPQALGGHQNCHKVERRLQKKNETMNKALEFFSNVGCGYQYCGIDRDILHAAGSSSSFDAWNLHHLQHKDQQSRMTEIDFGLFSEGGANSDADHEHKETQEEDEASKNIDSNLKL
ncbi:uncharacterized protein LOC131612338 [Vicia villosa]|uniref:uncharacterized protein LOC131612338 n=1 Tax=Vicia villosa TaxID=3911 RepID=UPI00273CBCD9|nr:uncharacterized protein LOC131612338 [Vicia villosa]